MKRIKLNPALRVSLVYLLVAASWVFLSDQILNILVRNQDQMAELASVKGVGFVVVTALLLYLERRASDNASSRAEAERLKAGRKYRDLFENAPVGIFEATRDGTYIDANTVFAHMLGYDTVGELLRAPAAVPQGPTQNMDALYDAGAGTLKYEWKHRRRDGRVIDAHLNVRVVADDAGQPPYLEGFMEDISDRKLAERKVNQLADIVQSSHDAIYSVDLDGCITSWNAAATAIYGYSAAEIEGRDVAVLQPPEQQGDHDYLRESIIGGKSLNQYETVRVRKDGSRFYVSMTASPIRDDSGQVTGMSVIGRDVTEREEMLQRMAAQQQTLQEYAHRLIQSQEEERRRLSRELHDDTVQDLVALVQRAELSRTALERDPAVAMRRLDDLQALAKEMVAKLRRISNDLRPLILEDLGIAAAVAFVGDELAQSMPNCAVSVDISGDERRLHPDVELTMFRIVQQSARNVRAHAPNATHAAIRMVFADDAIVASVQDDGAGFAVVDTQTLLRQGHLGIAGMQERARLLGGEVRVVSSPQTGTTINIQLPYVPVARSLSSGDSPGAQQQTG